MPAWILVSAQIMRGGGYVYFVDPDDVLRPDIVQLCVDHCIEKEYDAIVFGILTCYYSNGHVAKVVENIPNESRYCCSSPTEIVYGPLRYMYGTPAEDANQVLFYDRLKFLQFPWNWCWFYKSDVICKNNIRFREDLPIHEDGIFTCEFLMHANNTSCIQNIGYEYHKRLDGAGAYFHNNVKIENKLALVKYRQLIRRHVLDCTGIDIESWAYGSYVLSILQLCVALTGESKGFQKLKEYISLEPVKCAVKSTPLRGKVKLILPLFLCKCGCYRILFYTISFLKKMGYSVRL